MPKGTADAATPAAAAAAAAGGGGGSVAPPHATVAVDCSTFDRALLFLEAMSRGTADDFAFDVRGRTLWQRGSARFWLTAPTRVRCTRSRLSARRPHHLPNMAGALARSSRPGGRHARLPQAARVRAAQAG